MSYNDFTEVKMGKNLSYWAYYHDNGEICLEPKIFGGYYVASYNKALDLVQKKKDTKSLQEALIEAQAMYEKTRL